MSYHLGVDVGTTYTAAAIGRDGRAEAATLGTRSVSIPSVVCLADDRLLVGEPAARRAITDPGRVAREFKRRVGDPTPLLLGGSPVSAELCMARVVEWVVGHVSATEGSAPVSLALTHPASWGEYKLDLLRQGLRHVDLTVDRFVPEPVAAATTYAAQRSLPPGTTVAVYDLGGGTFDAALVRAGDPTAPGDEPGAQIIGRPDGVERLGGIDFDHAVYRYVLAAIGLDLDHLDPDDARTASGLAQLREECVEAKEALSHESDVSIPVMLPDRHTEVRLTRSEFEAMIRPALDETLVALRRTVASAHLRLEDVAAVLLVGGSSRIPLVSQLVTHDLGLPVAVDARPKDAISLGAAIVTMSAAGPSPSDAGAPVLTGGTALRPIAAPAVAGTPAAAAASSPPDHSPARSGSDVPLREARAVRGAPLPPGGGPFPGGPPPSGDHAPATAGPAGRSKTLAGLVAAIVVLVAVLVGVAATRDGGESAATGTAPATGESGDAQTDDAETDGADDEADSTSPGDSADPLGGVGGLGGIGGGAGLDGSHEAPLEPLPGDDWSDEARAAFLEDCSASGVGSQAALVGLDAADLCGCVYDDMSTETDFGTFNEQMTTDDFDPSSDFGQALTNVVLGCTISGA